MNWWTEEKVHVVVNREYIIGKLGSSCYSALHRALAFGDGLTDDTYLDWILSRQRRLFLIFDDIGIPEWIFEAVDRSFDDGDLPLSEEAIWDLNLSHGKTDALDKRFYRRQWTYIVQHLEKGSHVDYEADEIVPVEPVAKRTGLLTNPEVDRVYIKDELCTRRRIAVGRESGVDRIHFILHLKSLQRLSHPHIISVFATYIQSDYGYILLTPALDVSLKSFLEEPPKSFKALSKSERRETLLQWIYCLTSAIAYLHSKGHAHQALRPSNIFISSANKIHLGESAAFGALEEKSTSYDREAYDYGAPERWLRKPAFQETAPSRSTGHGGGRTVRRLPKDVDSTPISTPAATPRTSMNSYPNMPPSTALFHRPMVTKKTVPSLYPHPKSRSRASTVSIPSTPKILSQSRNRAHTTSSGSSTHSSLLAPKRTLITTFTPQTSSLAAISYFPADIFSISCLHLDLLTALLSLTTSSSSKFSSKSFSFYRSKRNRSAGRGGAPADSSFHANLGQVGRWIEKVAERWEKEWEGKWEEGRVVGGLLEVVRTGLRREGRQRWTGEVGRARVESLVGSLRFGRGGERGVGACCERANGNELEEEETDSEGRRQFVVDGAGYNSSGLGVSLSGDRDSRADSSAASSYYGDISYYAGSGMTEDSRDERGMSSVSMDDSDWPLRNNGVLQNFLAV